jgi:hypothetical protein
MMRSKGKSQNAKVKSENISGFAFCLLPFAF